MASTFRPASTLSAYHRRTSVGVSLATDPAVPIGKNWYGAVPRAVVAALEEPHRLGVPRGVGAGDVGRHPLLDGGHVGVGKLGMSDEVGEQAGEGVGVAGQARPGPGPGVVPARGVERPPRCRPTPRPPAGPTGWPCRGESVSMARLPTPLLVASSAVTPPRLYKPNCTSGPVATRLTSSVVPLPRSTRRTADTTGAVVGRVGRGRPAEHVFGPGQAGGGRRLGRQQARGDQPATAEVPPGGVPHLRGRHAVDAVQVSVGEVDVGGQHVVVGQRGRDGLGRLLGCGRGRPASASWPAAVGRGRSGRPCTARAGRWRRRWRPAPCRRRAANRRRTSRPRRPASRPTRRRC